MLRGFERGWMIVAHHKLLSSLYSGREPVTPLITSYGYVIQRGWKKTGIHHIQIQIPKG